MHKFVRVLDKFESINKQVLTTRHDVARAQRHNSQSKCLLSSCSTKIFHLAFVLEYTKGYEFYESNWIWSLQLCFKSLEETQGKAVEGYLSDQCMFVYLRTRSELLRNADSLREL